MLLKPLWYKDQQLPASGPFQCIHILPIQHFNTIILRSVLCVSCNLSNKQCLHSRILFVIIWKPPLDTEHSAHEHFKHNMNIVFILVSRSCIGLRLSSSNLNIKIRKYICIHEIRVIACQPKRLKKFGHHMVSCFTMLYSLL